MSVSMIRWLGRMLSVCLLGATGGFTYWQWQPVASDAGDSSTGPIVSARIPTPPEIPTADELVSLADQRLRPPLYDPPPEPEPEKPKPPPPPRLDLRLLGTIIERQRSRAVLAGPSGRTEIKGEGESVTSVPGDVTVANVTATQVVLRVGSANDAEVTITLEGGGTN